MPQGEDWEGGWISFVMRTDPEVQNYLTLKQWGSDSRLTRLDLRDAEGRWVLTDRILLAALITSNLSEWTVTLMRKMLVRQPAENNLPRSARGSDPAETADRRSPAIGETFGRPSGSVRDRPHR